MSISGQIVSEMLAEHANFKIHKQHSAEHSGNAWY